MATQLNTVSSSVMSTSSGILDMFSYFLPKLIGAMLVFLLGLILANWVKQMVVRALQSLNLDVLVKKTQLQQFLENAEFKTKIEEAIGLIFKWLVILLFTVTAINVLGLPTVSAVLNSALAYIPRIVSAIFVLGIGVLLAGVVERLIKGTVAQFDLRVGRLLGKVASYLMVIFASMAAVNELGIAKELINILFIGFVSMLAIGFGLAIGLGAKELVNQILLEWYQRFQKELKEGKRHNFE